MFGFPALIADIGGTNARFVYLDSAEASLDTARTYKTEDYPSFADCLLQLRQDLGSSCEHCHTIILAVAGPIEGTKGKLTNSPWIIDLQAFRGIFTFDVAALVNDFAAQAMSLPHWSADQIFHLGAEKQIGPTDGSAPKKPMVVIGPGTGFGVGALIWTGSKWFQQESELGHISFGPETKRQYSYWPFLQLDIPRISVEAVLSGQGLVDLYLALGRCDGRLKENIARPTPQQLGQMIRGGVDPVAQEALSEFAILMSRVAGDTALSFSAWDGVFISGGVMPRYLDLLPSAEMRHTFEQKTPLEDVLKTVPFGILRHANPGLYGLKKLIVHEEIYSLNLGGRILR